MGVLFNNSITVLLRDWKHIKKWGMNEHHKIECRFFIITFIFTRLCISFLLSLSEIFCAVICWSFDWRCNYYNDNLCKNFWHSLLLNFLAFFGPVLCLSGNVDFRAGKSMIRERKGYRLFLMLTQPPSFKDIVTNKLFQQRFCWLNLILLPCLHLRLLPRRVFIWEQEELFILFSIYSRRTSAILSYESWISKVCKMKIFNSSIFLLWLLNHLNIILIWKINKAQEVYSHSAFTFCLNNCLCTHSLNLIF